MHAPIYLPILPTNFIGIYDMLELTIRPSKGTKMNNNHWPWLVPTYVSSLKDIEDKGSSCKHAVVTPSPCGASGGGEQSYTEKWARTRLRIYCLYFLVELPDLANTTCVGNILIQIK